MRLSFLSSQHGNRDILSLDINLDSSYEHFLNVVLPVMGLDRNISYDIIVDGRTFSKADIVKAGSLQFMNLKENDLLILTPDIPLDLVEISENERLNLIRSIRYQRNPQKLRFEIATAKDGEVLYKQLLRSDESRRRQVRRQFDQTYPGLLDQFERRPNDKWAFLITYRNCIQKLESQIRNKGHLAAQEAMETQAEESRLRQNFETAIHETPEALIPVDMLYIKIKLNGVDGHAFIDTGAAKSLVSRDYVDRCGLSDLVNRESALQFRGIGGKQDSEGTIWLCHMTLESHEVPVTLHVVPNGAASHEVLLGLDLLLRHRANINLAERTLTLNNEVTTKFLTPAESAAYMQKERDAMTSTEDEKSDIQRAIEESAKQNNESNEPMETDQK